MILEDCICRSYWFKLPLSLSDKTVSCDKVLVFLSAASDLLQALELLLLEFLPSAEDFPPK